MNTFLSISNKCCFLSDDGDEGGEEGDGAVRGGRYTVNVFDVPLVKKNTIVALSLRLFVCF